MFSSKMRPPGFEAQLIACINHHYPIQARAAEPTSRGFYGETWKIYGTDGLYFAKLIVYSPQEAVYKQSFPIVEYMRNQGITFISEPILTRKGKYTVAFAGGTLGLYAYVPGIHTEEYPLSGLFSHLKKIYELPKPDIEIAQEDFSVDMPQQLRTVLQKIKEIEETDAHAKEVLQLIKDNAGEMRHYEEQLYAVYDLVRLDAQNFCITSGDVGGNVIIDGDAFTIIDWDHIVWAPKERDLWFYMQEMTQIDLVNAIMAPLPPIDPYRLAFYAFRQYFFYLQEYLDAFLLCPWARRQVVIQLTQYFQFDYFVNKCLRQADQFLQV